MKRDKVEKIATELLDRLVASKTISKYDIVGSYRRGKENLDEADVICIPLVDDEKFNAELKRNRVKVDVSGDKIKRFKWKGLKFDILCVADNYWGAARLYRTGNAQLNIVLRMIAKRNGYKLNEYGLWQGEDVIAQTEKGIFNKLGYKFIPPEKRTPKALKEHKLVR